LAGHARSVLEIWLADCQSKARRSTLISQLCPNDDEIIFSWLPKKTKHTEYLSSHQFSYQRELIEFAQIKEAQRTGPSVYGIITTSELALCQNH
jgi:hypothetical protein